MQRIQAITGSEPVKQQIYRYLFQDIITCAIPPGALLSEKEVSTRFSVSRQPVREAFIKLAEANLVLILPQRGTFVRKISPQCVRDGRFIREVVEVAVIRRAAHEASPEALASLEQNLQLQKLAVRQHNNRTFLQLDDQFHRLIARSINCELAWKTIENIKATLDRVRFLSLSGVSSLESLYQQHSDIFQAITEGDAGAAVCALQRHLQALIFSLTPIIEHNRDWFELS